MILEVEVPRVNYELMPEILASRLSDCEAGEQSDFLFEFANDLTPNQMKALASDMCRYYNYGKSMVQFFKDMTEMLQEEMLVRYKRG